MPTITMTDNTSIGGARWHRNVATSHVFFSSPLRRGTGRTSRYCTGGGERDRQPDRRHRLPSNQRSGNEKTRQWKPSREQHSHCTRSCDKWSTTKLRSRSSPTTWDAIRYPDQHRQQPSCTLAVKFFELLLVIAV